MRVVCIYLLAISGLMPAAQAPAGRPVDDVLADYLNAVGGSGSVDRLSTREILMDVRHARDLTIYWEKPNHVLAIGKRERTGFDGGHGWTLTKAKVKKLPRGSELPLQMEADPLRWVHLKDLYEEINPAPSEEIDGAKMDVLIAPNKLGAAKLYFDAQSHLLRRVEEKGEISAYFTNTFDYLDYQTIDGVQYPYRIIHQSTEPNVHAEEFRAKQITHNLQLASAMFSKPLPGAAVLGGKR